MNENSIKEYTFFMDHSGYMNIVFILNCDQRRTVYLFIWREILFVTGGMFFSRAYSRFYQVNLHSVT